MADAAQLAGENAALRERLSRLSEASLRINESLDLDSVLQEVVDSARALTEAHYGVIALFDLEGQVEHSFTSGLTADERAQLTMLPASPELFAHLRETAERLRVPDLYAYARELGLPEIALPMLVSPTLPFLTTPIVHHGQRLGAVYLAGRGEGQVFSAEDQDVFETFVSQASMVIASARRYDERRARLDMETLFETTPVAVAVFDARAGRPASINREMERLMRGLLPPGEELGYLLGVLSIERGDGEVHPLGGATMVEWMTQGGTVRAEEVKLTVPDGRSVSALMNATPIRIETGEVDTYIVTLQDMTPLQELERLRAEFLAMVSHELRTPLTSVKGAITTLLDPSAALNPGEQFQFHRIIDAQTDRMRILISDLLDVARIETGTLSTSPEPTDLAVLVGEASEAFRSSGGKHPIQLDIAPALPWVMADRSRLVQVLSNLLSNAARNSHELSPIRVKVTRADIHLTVSVSDEGRGILAENLPHLFRKFSRPGSDGQGGDTGLGLAICKGIVEGHGGRIWAESDGPGLGARFSFTIPTAEEPVTAPSGALARSRAAAPGHRVDLERTRILAVDDDPEALRYVRDTLLKAGYEPLVTGDPMEAMRLMKEQPQLVLLDLMLPGIDGIELMGEIHKAHDLPVLFLSAYGLEEVVERAFDAGAADYIVKPFAPVELTARIRAALRKQAPPEPLGSYVVGDLEIDYAERRVTLAGRPVRLTSIEYRTLAELATNAGRVVTTRNLLRRVWGVDEDADVRPIRTVISTLRRRLADSATSPRYIFTEPRVGYRLAVPDAPGTGPEGK